LRKTRGTRRPERKRRRGDKERASVGKQLKRSRKEIWMPKEVCVSETYREESVFSQLWEKILAVGERRSGSGKLCKSGRVISVRLVTKGQGFRFGKGH